jgi:putative tRNA adenosine deaminase-associated protein
VSYFAAALARRGDRWIGDEAALDDCESLDDVGDLLRDLEGDVRLMVIEQDDAYAAIVRLDANDDHLRAFLSDGHAADEYPMAALIAEDLTEIGGDDLEDDEDAPPAHDSAPFGEADVVEDLGLPAGELIAVCEHEGTLPVDVLLAVCEKAGCVEVFEDLRG